MELFDTAFVVEAYQAQGQDRCCICKQPDGVVIIVADGAGGTGSGDVAADLMVRDLQLTVAHATSAIDWESRLRELDHQIGDGESTAVVVSVTSSGVCGASVGDSQAWVVRDGNIDVLTASQVRKPLLGSGGARPVAFSRESLDGLLIVATDGLYNYVRRERLLATLPNVDFAEAPRALLDLVRLRSGALQDDVAIVVCRRRPIRSRPVVYDILKDL